MNTYRVNEEWNTFQQFIFNNLHQVDRDAIGFMYRENEIIIRSINESILDIIRKQYTLMPCEQPGNYLNNCKEWAYMGNQNLFDVIL